MATCWASSFSVSVLLSDVGVMPDVLAASAAWVSVSALMVRLWVVVKSGRCCRGL